MTSFQNCTPYDVIVCDIDGCLSPETSSPINIENLACVAEHNRLATKQGDRPILTVCSGRPQPFAEAMCRFLQNDSVPCVAENGAWLYHPGTNQYELDPAITSEHLSAVHEASALLHRKYSAKGVTQQPGKTAAVTLYHRSTAVLYEILDEVRDMFAQRNWPFRVSMTVCYINCDLEHISKASGIRRLYQAANIDPNRTLGVGDTVSDQAIADNVAWFTCPANADAQLKASANFVSELEECAGVLDIIHRYATPQDS